MLKGCFLPPFLSALTCPCLIKVNDSLKFENFGPKCRTLEADLTTVQPDVSRNTGRQNSICFDEGETGLYLHRGASSSERAVQLNSR